MTSADILEYYVAQSDVTDLGTHAPLFEALPAEIPALCRTVQGLVIHVAWAGAYGLEIPEGRRPELEIQRVSERLAHIQSLDSRPLNDARPVPARMLGTCRDFALILCSALRHRRIPARVRCGFATYLRTGHYEDHWICEYWNAHERRWVMVDAQLDDLQRDRLGILFESTDLPPGCFLPAGRAWQICRADEADQAAFGNGSTTGLWFVHVNVMRDLLSLAKREVSQWDTWRVGSTRGQMLSGVIVALVDRLAKTTEGVGYNLAIPGIEEKVRFPPWL